MMKNIFLLALLGAAATASFGQNINWQSFQAEQKHIVSLQTGWDYSLHFAAAYGRKFKFRIPIVASAEYGFPAGEQVFDDFKVRVGVQAELFRLHGFSATAKVFAPIRRFENSKVRLFNFGAEVSGALGFYQKGWFVAGEFGFDKAVATHVKHGKKALENYPGAVGGWYVPTGGTYFYGMQAGLSFGKTDLSVRAGSLKTQGWKTAPFIPKYALLALNRRF